MSRFFVSFSRLILQVHVHLHKTREFAYRIVQTFLFSRNSYNDTSGFIIEIFTVRLFAIYNYIYIILF